MYGRGMISGSNPTSREYDPHTGHFPGAPLSCCITAVPARAVRNFSEPGAAELRENPGRTAPSVATIGLRFSEIGNIHKPPVESRGIQCILSPFTVM
jgi:hypothetical protein